MNHVHSLHASRAVAPSEGSGALRRLGARIWRSFESAGMARASSQLDQLAQRYEASQPNLANELRAASKYAGGFKSVRG